MSLLVVIDVNGVILVDTSCFDLIFSCYFESGLVEQGLVIISLTALGSYEWRCD